MIKRLINIWNLDDFEIESKYFKIKEEELITLYYTNKASNYEQLEDVIKDIEKKGILSKAYDFFDKYKISKFDEIKLLNQSEYYVYLQREKPILKDLEFYVKVNLPFNVIKKKYNPNANKYEIVVYGYIPKKYIKEIKAYFEIN